VTTIRTIFSVVHPMLAVVLLIFMCATPYFARRVLLRPVFASAKEKRRAARFTVTDVAALTGYFAIAAGLTKLIADLVGEALASYITLVSLCYVIGTWYLGVQSLDAAHIREGRRRIAYLSLAVPFAYAGSMTIVVLTSFGVYFRYFETRRYMRSENIFGADLWIVWCVYGFLWLSLILAWQIARWVVQENSAATSITESAPSGG
jgi:hypothetical protein